jgi:P4 family phage/plasmid primase-like protien
MSNPLDVGHITVMKDKYCTGFSGTRSEDPLATWPTMPLLEALGRTHDTDAHFAPYHLHYLGGPDQVVPEIPRINIEAIPTLTSSGFALAYDVLPFDVDFHQLPEIEVRAMAAAQRRRLEQQGPPVGAAAWYETHGGLRLVYVLSEPVSTDEYLSIWEHMRQQLTGIGIDTDLTGKQLTRLYRLPLVRRRFDDGNEVDQVYPSGFERLSPISVRELLGPKPEFPGLPDLVDCSRHFRGIENVRLSFELPSQIEFGTRASTLWSYACQLRSRGMDEPHILEGLLAADRERCKPPMQSDATEFAKLRGIAARVADYPVRNTPIPSNTNSSGLREPLEIGSEVEVAQRVLDVLEGGKVQFRADRAELWRFSGTVWEIVPCSEVQGAVAAMDGTTVHTGTDNKGRAKSRSLKVSKAMTENVYSLIVDTFRSAPGWFDDAPAGVAFRNGFLRCDTDCGTVELEAPSPDHRVRYCLPFDYVATATAPRFMRYLDEVFRDDSDREQKKALMGEFVGAALLALATRYQRALLLLGQGDNGKSVFLHAIMALFEDEALAAISPQEFADDYKGAMLERARLNVVNEMPDNDILSGSAFKAMVTGDLITRRNIRDKPVRFQPSAGHIFAANSLPGTSDKTVGFWRRWHIVEFNRAFAEAEKDHGLAARLVATELPGIAAWAVSGACRLMAQRGYTVPASSHERMETWRRTADPVALFMSERTEPGDRGRCTGATALRQAFDAWSIQNGYRSLSTGKFHGRLELLGVKAFKNSSNYYEVVLNPPSG